MPFLEAMGSSLASGKHGGVSNRNRGRGHRLPIWWLMATLTAFRRCQPDGQVPNSRALAVIGSARNDGARLSVSVVVFRPDVAALIRTLDTLRSAISTLNDERGPDGTTIFLVDNGGLPDVGSAVQSLHAVGADVAVLSGHGNVGYGRGHNIALQSVGSRYHLILNPDVDIEPSALADAIAFLDDKPEVGLLAPRIGDEHSALQHLCRRFPSLVDLAVRGFIPVAWRKWFRRRLAHYEMRDVINDRDVVWDPPIVSGCFMLFRTEVLKKLGGFDPRYFLYFEDYDLSLRTHDVARVAYVPSVRVIHHGGGASRKGFAHIRMFAASAFKFYNRFGWRLW
ncbi:glycosyltransferase family 2 protein [Burkholderia sola]|uniref:glycosyltransferase family 2 protein n=1 Tax=unclassified Burkholderia TaxID=2613784 RepID=UPI001EF6880D|nr:MULTISPECIES: glycosyltransferase family 2 protein [unclassified Burkholderia]